MDPIDLKNFFEVGGASQLLLNPRLPIREQKWAQAARLPFAHDHLWISSSGTTSFNEIKLIGLSRSALLAGAKGSNQFLQADRRDRWLNALPIFHVGGLAIWARAFLSQAQVFEVEKWDLSRALDIIDQHQVTLMSLVPTQVYDIVQRRKKAPFSLRAVLVGGGRLTHQQYRQARELGWPVLPTYGMSEAGSQIATVPLASLNERHELVPEAQLLPHIEARLSREGRLEIRGDSLFSGYVYASEGSSRFEDPKIDGWFTTSDFVELSERNLKFIGRAQDMIKVNGELVNLSRLQELFQTLLPDVSLVVTSAPNPRSGAQVVVAFESISPFLAEAYVEKINAQVSPFERVQALHVLEVFPRTPLGKIKIAELRASLGYFSESEPA